MERKTANFALCCSCICISYLNMIYMDIISNGIALKKYHLYNFNKFSPFYIKKVNNFLLFHWMKGRQRNRLKTNQRLEVDLIKSVFMVGKINSVTFFLSDEKWGHGGEDKTAINCTRGNISRLWAYLLLETTAMCLS